MKSLIYLLRHGETVWNRSRRVQGHLDSPLTLRGIDQARRHGLRLRDGLLGNCQWQMVSSPLGRCRQTAAIVAEIIGADPASVRTDDRLKETSWGEWDGMTAEEIEANDPVRWQDRIDSGFRNAPPGGESKDEMLARARSWLASIADGERLIVTSHGAFGKAIRCAYQNLSFDDMLTLAEPQDALFELCGGRVVEWPHD